MDLSSSKKFHIMFHVSLLDPYRECTIPRRLQTSPSPIKIDMGEEFEVSKIFNSCINWRRLEYLVHWQDYVVNAWTWKTWNLVISNLITMFHLSILILIFSLLELFWILCEKSPQSITLFYSKFATASLSN